MLGKKGVGVSCEGGVNPYWPLLIAITAGDLILFGCFGLAAAAFFGATFFTPSVFFTAAFLFVPATVAVAFAAAALGFFVVVVVAAAAFLVTVVGFFAAGLGLSFFPASDSLNEALTLMSFPFAVEFFN